MRDLDAQVAEKVMKDSLPKSEPDNPWILNNNGGGYYRQITELVGEPGYSDEYITYMAHWPFYYSTVIQDAWLVVEEWGNRVTHGESFELTYDGQWTAFFSENYGASVDEHGPKTVQATASTAPEAICRAALKAVDG